MVQSVTFSAMAASIQFHPWPQGLKSTAPTSRIGDSVAIA
jgi:hypothetical protein